MKRIGTFAIIALYFMPSACTWSSSPDHPASHPAKSTTKVAFKNPKTDWVFFAKDRLGGEIAMKCAGTSMIYEDDINNTMSIAINHPLCFPEK